MNITDIIENNKKKIVELLNKNIDLQYQGFLNKCHRFYEKEVNIGSKKEPKLVIAKYGCWYEWFKDESEPRNKGVRIERKSVVSVDGEKSNGFRLIEYFTIDDI